MQHLLSDPNAAGYGRAVRRGALSPWLASLPDRHALGGLNTLFGNLGVGSGSRVALDLVGHEKFLVREALAAWRSSRGDEGALAKLEQYLGDARAGRLRDRTLTVLERTRQLVDGNKRAIALYEAGDAVGYPVDVVVLRAARNV